jgi:hypothetical protein
MNSTSENIKIRPNSTISRAHTFISNSQADFSSENRRHHALFTTDFKSMSMTEMNSESSSKDFSHEYEPIKSISHPILTTENEDDENVLSNSKTYVDQGSQVMFEELKLKKKKKNESLKKIKSSLKRTKVSNGPQIPPPTSATRLTSNGDLISSTKSSTTSIIKTDENSGTKSLITVDTSKARSNLEVVRLCIRELGWKEVLIFFSLNSFIFFFLDCVSSVHQIHQSIQIYIGIHLHFMKEIQILHLIPVE